MFLLGVQLLHAPKTWSISSFVNCSSSADWGIGSSLVFDSGPRPFNPSHPSLPAMH